MINKFGLNIILILLLSACLKSNSDSEATLSAFKEISLTPQVDPLIKTLAFETEVAVRLTELAPTREPILTDTPIPTQTPAIFSNCTHWTQISYNMDREEICAYGNAVSIDSGVRFSFPGSFFVAEIKMEDLDFEDGDCVAVIGEISIQDNEVPYMDTASAYHCQPFMDLNISYINRCGDEIEEYCLLAIGTSYDDQLINIQKAYSAEGNIKLKINGKIYKCRSVDSAPETVYCIGPIINQYESALVEVFTSDRMDLLARGIFNLPAETSPPETSHKTKPGSGSTSTPTCILISSYPIIWWCE